MQEHTEDAVMGGRQRQLMDGSLIISGEKQLEHIYDNEDLFPTMPNGTTGNFSVPRLMYVCNIMSTIDNYARYKNVYCKSGNSGPNLIEVNKL